MQYLIILFVFSIFVNDAPAGCADITSADLVGRVQNQQDDFIEQIVARRNTRSMNPQQLQQARVQARETLESYYQQVADGTMTVRHQRVAGDGSYYVGESNEVIFRTTDGRERIFRVQLRDPPAASSVDEVMAAGDDIIPQEVLEEAADLSREQPDTVLHAIRRRTEVMAESQGVIRAGANNSNALASFSYDVGRSQRVQFFDAFARNHPSADSVEVVFLGHGKAATVKVKNAAGQVIDNRILTDDQITQAISRIRSTD